MSEVVFAIVEDALARLGPRLASLFTHPWVASYQIGFGPPLVRSSDRIMRRVKEAKSALEKLDAYLELCILDEPERTRLAGLHRRLLVRRLGPVEAEAIDEASAEALDLSVRLHHPALAPPAVQSAMRALGISSSLLPLHSPPEALSARFLVRLGDPQNTRLLDHEKVRALAKDGDGLVLELRVPPPVRSLYAAWLPAAGARVVELDAPAAHARVKIDGVAT